MTLTNGRTLLLRYVRAQRPRCTRQWAARRDPPGLMKSCKHQRDVRFSPVPGTPPNAGWFDPHSVAKLSELTPIPLRNKQTKHATRPGVPSIYVFAIPNKARDSGIK